MTDERSTSAEATIPTVVLPQVPAKAAGQDYKDAAADITTDGGDTSPVAEEAMVVHAGDNHDMGAGMLAGTPLVGQPSTLAKGDGNDDECDIEGGELHHRMDDPAVHGDIAPERHGKEEHGYSGDNKKNAVGDPAAAKDEDASHKTKEASIVQANDDHGLDDCMEEEVQAVAAQGRASVEAPKSSAGAPTMTCAAKKPVTAAAGKPRQNAAKGSKATPVKAVTPRRKVATQHSGEDCVGGNEVAVVDKPDISAKDRIGDELPHGDEETRKHKDCAETKKSRRGERKVAEVVKEVRECQSGDEEIGDFRHGETDVAEEGRAEENTGGDDGTGGWEAAASGADGEAEEDAEEVKYYEAGMVRDGEWDEKTKCVDAGDADYDDYVNDAAGVEEKPVEEASDSRAEKSETSQISEKSERARPEKPNGEFATSVLEPYNGSSPSETMHWTMAEPTPVYAERFKSGKYKDEEADRNCVKGIHEEYTAMKVLVHGKMFCEIRERKSRYIKVMFTK
ncbi:hypothetical protein HPB52_022397 [Rhipicephalus sanguineus]|uniref:Uncharacterized protein n=1 Tax=Rhipicephalus sanguineus TaxID=34632 RepID=A0A9D4Q852_RHISA|nr:hypothetical protein HPB52_022397 [Rhipicephalus sanguineus]